MRTITVSGPGYTFYEFFAGAGAGGCITRLGLGAA